MRVSKRRKANRITPRGVRIGRNFFLVLILSLALFQAGRKISLSFAHVQDDPSISFTKDFKVEMDIKVFIGIKTSIRGVHGDRLPQIEKTWLQDVVTRPEVDLKFFADESQDAAIELNNTDSSPSSSWIVQTPSCEKWGEDERSLCCKDELMFKYFIEHYVSLSDSPFSPWFCSFDDDSYVLIDNLLQILRSYQRQTDTKLYIGRPSVPEGLSWAMLNGTLVHFLNGGAGYCISRELMEFGRDRFSNFFELCISTVMPDDVAVGYLVNNQLGVEQRFDEHFHDHIEIVSNMPQDKISKQVSFAYNNKRGRARARQRFPRVPILYPAEEDPMLFQSLRAFLLKDAESQGR